MRRYLESGIDFEWPEGVGERDGNHCTLNRPDIPLKWLSRISDKKASIDIYMAGEQYAFKELFAVKTIREKTTTKAKTRARNEVENMRDLRFPHVAALLGSFTPSATVVHDDLPLKIPFPVKVDSLRGYFVCLSQALSYIHESDVRHKDIKPENILIDASGSVVLTDFGISRRFPKQTPHVTNDKWEWTRKYASPEIMQGKRAPRDDPSDVFSLGCVFLEMASLILGRDLQTMCDHYASTVNNSALEDAYYCNLERVYDWIQHIAKPREAEPRSTTDLTGERIIGQDFVPDLNSRMVEALATLRLMLDIDPHKRPRAKSLWERFQHVSAQMCRDCDPRSEEMWTPTPRQKDAAESGTTARRRSRQLIPEEAMDNSSMGARDGRPRNGTLLNPYYKPDRNSLMGRRASSPNPGLDRTHARRLYDSAPVHVQPPREDGSHPCGSTDPTIPASEENPMRRTSSASDGRRATAQKIPAASRSMSPEKRRRSSEMRLQPGVAQAFDTSTPPPPVLPLKRDKARHPSPPSQYEHVPVAQNASGSSYSLAVKKHVPKSEDSGAQEKSGQNGQEQLDSSTQIIIYDLAKKKAYVGAYAQVEGNPGLFPNMILF
ncbi:MAG: hypothetical protein Q9196_002966 [Gyalolechia fulgens]